jgi:glutathione synthase
MRFQGPEFNLGKPDADAGSAHPTLSTEKPMSRILFLIAEAANAHNDNHRRLPAAFLAAGWHVDVRNHDCLRLADGQLLAFETPLADYDRIWVLGLGRAETFFDRMQLLRRAPQDRLITRIDALLYHHAKYAWSEFMPETYASNDPDWLAAIVARGGDWVAKPTAGSYGRDVVRVGADADGLATLRRLTAETSARYCLLQRFAPEIAGGEKRTLIAGRALIGTYLRLPGQDFRTNLSLDGRPARAALTAAERQLVDRIQAELVREGIGFAAIDIAWPYLMEVNLANPGGLATLEEVYGRDFAPAVVRALTWTTT